MNSVHAELIVKYSNHPWIFIFFQMFHQNYLLDNIFFPHFNSFVQQKCIVVLGMQQ